MHAIFDSRQTAALFGLASVIVTFLFIKSYIKDQPSEIGLYPDGISPDGNEPPGLPELTFRQAFKSRAFWYIVGALLLACTLEGLPVWQLRVEGTSISAFTAGALFRDAAFVVLPFVGLLADRKRADWTFAFLLCVAALGLLVFSIMPAKWIVVVLPPFQSVFILSIGVVVPIIIAERFGLTRFGIIFAIIMLLSGFGSSGGIALFSWIPGLLFDVGYGSRATGLRIVFVIEIILLVLSAYLMREIKQATNEAQSMA
jgi:hypothetical protein